MDRLDLEENFCKRTSHLYSDKFLANPAVNRCFYLVERLVILWQRSSLNFATVTRKTVYLRDKYASILDYNGGKSNDKGGQRDSYRSLINLDDRINWYYFLNLFTVICIAVVLVTSSSIHGSRAYESYRITSVKTTIDIKYTLCSRYVMFKPEREKKNSTSLIGNCAEGSLGDIGCSIPTEIESDLASEYEGFCIWRSRQLEQKLWTVMASVLWSDGTTFLFGQTWSLLLVMAGHLIFVNITGSWALNYINEDVPVLLFIYDPRFAVTLVHRRMNVYLDMLNRSYKLQSIARKQVEIIMADALGLTINDENRFNGNNKLIRRSSDDNPSFLDKSNFEYYIPIPRCQLWRRILAVAHSFSCCLVITLGVVIGIGIYVLTYRTDVPTFELNRKLKESLLNTYQADWKSKWLANFLYNFTKTTFDTLNLGTEWYDPKSAIEEKSKLINQMIAPTQMAPEANIIWLFLFASVNVMTSCSAIAFGMLVIVLADLIVWVFVIKLKLEICIVILEHYDLIHGDNRSRMPYTRAEMRYSVDWMPVDLKAAPKAEGFNFVDPQLEHLVRVYQRLGKSDPFEETNSFCPRRREKPSKALSWRESMGQGEGSDLRLDFNLHLRDILSFVLAHKSAQNQMVQTYAAEVIYFDRRTSNLKSNRQASEHFLISTYLDFRIFRDQVEMSKETIHIITVYGIVEAMLLVVLCWVPTDEYLRWPVIIFMACYMLATLFLVSFFHVQTSKLTKPILNLLATTIRGNKATQFVALLWRRGIADLYGTQSLFNYKVLTVTVSYATTLEVSFDIRKFHLIYNSNKTNENIYHEFHSVFGDDFYDGILVR